MKINKLKLFSVAMIFAIGFSACEDEDTTQVVPYDVTYQTKLVSLSSILDKFIDPKVIYGDNYEYFEKFFTKLTEDINESETYPKISKQSELNAKDAEFASEQKLEKYNNIIKNAQDEFNEYVKTYYCNTSINQSYQLSITRDYDMMNNFMFPNKTDVYTSDDYKFQYTAISNLVVKDTVEVSDYSQLEKSETLKLSFPYIFPDKFKEIINFTNEYKISDSNNKYYTSDDIKCSITFDVLTATVNIEINPSALTAIKNNKGVWEVHFVAQVKNNNYYYTKYINFK
ncbi:MAG: hypothetical protein MJ211_11620 [Bacteroidales bacterium]|nr:hypothetical protein [Bacteroidales bacterium]